MKYALLLYADESLAPDPDSPEMAAEMQEWAAFTDRIVAKGLMLGGEALHPAAAATVVRKRNDTIITEDGPFAETKEVLGGFYLIEAENIDTAIEAAAEIPNVHYGTVEIRPIVDFSDTEWA